MKRSSRFTHCYENRRLPGIGPATLDHPIEKFPPDRGTAMKLTRKTALVLALFVLGSAVTESANAHRRGRIGVGLYFGVPLGGWGWYGSPYYPYYPSYPASVVYVPSQPTTYI